MSFWKYLDQMKRPRLRLIEGPAPKPGFFWQRFNPRVDDQRAPLPEVGELVRLQTGAISDLGVYFAHVRSIGPRRIVLQMEDQASAVAVRSETSTGTPVSSRQTVLVTYDRGEALYHFQAQVVGDPRDAQLILSRPREVRS